MISIKSVGVSRSYPALFSWAPADSDNSTQININNAGIYYCQTTNLAGSSTAVIALDVQSKNNLSDFYVHK